MTKKITHMVTHIRGCKRPELHEDKYAKGAKLQDKYTDKSRQTDALEVWFSGCHCGELPPYAYGRIHFVNCLYEIRCRGRCI